MAFDNSGMKAVVCDHPQKGVNYHLSSPQLEKSYVMRKLSISEASICSFSRIGQKIKNYSSLNFLQENLEKFHSTELLWWASRGMDNFSLSQLNGPHVFEKLSISWVEICNFSRTGRKTKKLQHSNLFLSTVFKHGLLEGSTFLFQYSSITGTPLESSRLGELKCAISAG